MFKETVLDDLRRIELAVVEEERQLAEQEALLVALKRQSRDLSQAQALLERMREYHRLQEKDRQRLLAMLQT
jgi:hypothetical protein